jgi:hypothetical protein
VSDSSVTCQDTVTMLRGAIRGLLRACPPELVAKVGGLLRREDDDAAAGKPACDWADPAAREALVNALVRDGYRALVALRGERLDARVAEAAALLATVGRWGNRVRRQRLRHRRQPGLAGHLRAHPKWSRPRCRPHPAGGSATTSFRLCRRGRPDPR